MWRIRYASGINALGDSLSSMRENWTSNRTPGMRRIEGLQSGKKPYFGFTDVPLMAFPERTIAKYQTRNNQLLWTAIAREYERWASLCASLPPERIGVVLGTSTLGSQEMLQWVKNTLGVATQEEVPYALKDFPEAGWAQEMGDPALFVARLFGLKGPCYVVSTACTSSSRALISAARLLEQDLVDAVIVGGVDTFAQMPLNGFDSLGVLSENLTQPLSAQRSGITIGEGVGLIWLERCQPSDSQKKDGLYLLGWGESSDAYHMSSPEPEGRGVERALREALARAQLEASEIDYLNLHGTGTLQNDSAECAAVSRVLGQSVCVSSSKALTGHTLGAAGITDALLCLSLCQAQHVVLPGQFDPVLDASETPLKTEPGVWDTSLAPVRWIQEPTELTVNIAISTNVAFGGSNTALVLGRYQG